MQNILFLFICTIVVWCHSNSALAGPLIDDREEVTLEAQGHEFQVHYYFDKTGAPKGGLVITYLDAHLHLVNNLGYVLSQFGWSVLLINMDEPAQMARRTFNEPPEPNQPVQPNANPEAVIDETSTAAAKEPADEAEQETSVENDESPAEVKTTEADNIEALAGLTSDAKLTSVVDYLGQVRGQFNLVFMSIDRSWEDMAQFVLGAANGTDKVQGLILLDVSQLVPLSKLPVALPILDLSSRRSQGDAYLKRTFDAKLCKLENFQQIHLPTKHWQYAFKQDRLAKRIRGWLALKVKGMEVSRRMITRTRLRRAR